MSRRDQPMARPEDEESCPGATAAAFDRSDINPLDSSAYRGPSTLNASQGRNHAALVCAGCGVEGRAATITTAKDYPRVILRPALPQPSAGFSAVAPSWPPRSSSSSCSICRRAGATAAPVSANALRPCWASIRAGRAPTKRRSASGSRWRRGRGHERRS